MSFLAGRVAHALAELMPAEREGATVIFSAHSLPVRKAEDGGLRCLRCTACDASCRYRDGLQETADLVAAELGLARHTIAWQSAGRTGDPWWGPPVEAVIEQLAADGRPAVVVCSAGFVADHLEILYDLDIEARRGRGAGRHPVRPDRDAERRPRVHRGPGRRRAGAARAVEGLIPPMGARVVVVGGGVAGLTAAYRLVGSDPELDVTVLEAEPQPGGRLATAAVGGLELDAGPDSFVARKPWAVELCRELGLELVEPGSRGAFAWTPRGLVPLPTSALGIPADIDELARWPGLSRRGRARALTDLVRKAETARG